MVYILFLHSICCFILFRVQAGWWFKKKSLTISLLSFFFFLLFTLFRGGFGGVHSGYLYFSPDISCSYFFFIGALSIGFYSLLIPLPFLLFVPFSPYTCISTFPSSLYFSPHAWSEFGFLYMQADCWLGVFFLLFFIYSFLLRPAEVGLSGDVVLSTEFGE